MIKKLLSRSSIFGFSSAIVFFLAACVSSQSASPATPTANNLSQGLLQKEYFLNEWELLKTSTDVSNYEPSDKNDYISKVVWIAFGAIKDKSHVFTIKHYLYCFEKPIQNDTIEKIIMDDVVFPVKNRFLVDVNYSNDYQCASDIVGDLTSINCYVATVHQRQQVISLLQVGVSPADLNKADVESILSSLYSNFSERVQNIRSCD